MPLRTRWRVWTLWGIGALSLAAVALWARNVAEGIFRDRAEEKLRVVLDAQATAMTAWFQSQGKLLQWMSTEPRLRQAALAAHAHRGAAADVLRALPERQQAVAVVAPILASHGLENFAFTDTTGRILLSSDPLIVGDTTTAYPPEVRQALQGGRALAVPPMTYRRKLPGGQVDRTERVGFLLATPFPGTGRDADRVIGWMDVLVDAEAQLYPLLAIGRFGKTGETFAIDQAGYLVSPSRFEPELRKIGLLPRDTSVHSPLGLRVRDPGGDLGRGFQPPNDPAAWQPTQAAVAAIQGDTAVGVARYRSYRGREVIGAWRWLPQFGIVLATEQEVEELYQPMAAMRRLLWLLLGLLTLAAVLLGFGGVHLRRAAGQARIGRRLGQYTLERLIGEGAMGAVYRARHALLRRPTAVKLLRPDRNTPQALRRFKREVEATSQLVHPNTITIFDYGHAPDGTFYYAMELLRGLTLDAVVARFGPMAENRVAHILRQVCGSLAEAHDAGLVHRDIKPQNLMLCHRGGVPDTIKVLDFGLVKGSQREEDPRLTRDGASVGTPLYMSPEIASISAETDARADIYSLGVVAYYLLTGEQPFGGSNAREVMRRHVEERPVPPSEKLGRPLHQNLESTVLRCLAKSPDARPQSARQLETMLADVIIPCLDPWTESDADAWWRANLPDLIGPGTELASDDAPATLTVDVQSRVTPTGP